MPLSTELYQEGLIIPPLKPGRGGPRQSGSGGAHLPQLPHARRPAGGSGGADRLYPGGGEAAGRIAERYGPDDTQAHMDALLDYSERLTRRAIAEIPDGVYRVTDYMDDDGQSEEPWRSAWRLRWPGTG